MWNEIFKLLSKLLSRLIPVSKHKYEKVNNVTGRITDNTNHFNARMDKLELKIDNQGIRIDNGYAVLLENINKLNKGNK